MKTKTILTMAIIAAFPFGAMAENISGAMYTAPATADTNHPAPTTNGWAPYGRIDIDTADQEHIATTAYVKGAYNSAIAAVNNESAGLHDRIAEVEGTKQNELNDWEDGGPIYPTVLGSGATGIAEMILTSNNADYAEFKAAIGNQLGEGDHALISAGAVMQMIRETGQYIQNNKRVEIYTTWDDDTAKQQVAFVNVQ